METSRLNGGTRQADRSGVRFAGCRRKTRSLGAFRAKVRREREIDTVGEALMLRGKPPEESIEIMFDMVEFAEDLAKAVEDAWGIKEA